MVVARGFSLQGACRTLATNFRENRQAETTLFDWPLASDGTPPLLELRGIARPLALPLPPFRPFGRPGGRRGLSHECTPSFRTWREATLLGWGHPLV